MEQQLSLLAFREELEGISKPDSDPTKYLTEEGYPQIRENLLIESIKSAFGVSRGGRNRKPCDEAWEWIISTDGEMPFSFTQCCNEMGVNPETMIDWLRWYKRKKLN